MSLSIKLAGTVNDKTASEILFKDTTGAYASPSNTGGYGVANDFITPTYGFLRWKYWTDTAWVNTFLDSLTDILGSDGLTRTPTEAGLTGDVFSDGIHQVEYVPLNSAAVSAVFTNGSKTVTFSGWDPTAIASELVAFIAGVSGGANTTDILEVDTFTSTTITLKEAFTGTTQTVALYFGPVKDIKILVNKAAEACIAKTLASGTTVDCGCATNSDNVTKMIQWRFTADVLFDCEDYVGAHNTLVQINRVCNPLTCLC
jgi:hypothetical protein